MALDLIQKEVIQNVIIFGADLSNPKHANDKTKIVLILG